jgi:hypothetical protein
MLDPSLVNLKLYLDGLENPDDAVVSTVDGYLNETLSKWSGGCYYMGGQIKMFPSDTISETSFDHAKEAIASKFVTYGGPYNSAEAGSMQRSSNGLENMRKLLNMYLEDHTLLVKPAGRLSVEDIVVTLQEQ